MTALGHVATASLVRGHPVLRLTWGFISHWLLDITVAEYPYPPVIARHIKWYAYQTVGVLLFCYLTGDWWAILYAMLPDILEGVYIAYRYLVYKENAWNSGKLLFWFHYYRNMLFRKQWSAVGTVALETVLVVIVFVMRRYMKGDIKSCSKIA